MTSNSALAEARTELFAGALVVVTALLFLGWAAQDRLSTGAGYKLHASFPDVDGVSVGTEVRLAGVRIGRVSEIRLNPATYMADATLTIPRDVLIPADSAALIQSDGLLGGAYIQLQPGGSLDNLEAGDEIEDVQGAVSLLQLMLKFVDSQSGPDAAAEAQE